MDEEERKKLRKLKKRKSKKKKFKTQFAVRKFELGWRIYDKPRGTWWGPPLKCTPKGLITHLNKTNSQEWDQNLIKSYLRKYASDPIDSQAYTRNNKGFHIEHYYEGGYRVYINKEPLDKIFRYYPTSLIFYLYENPKDRNEDVVKGFIDANR